MSPSDAQKRATRKWQTERVEEIRLRIPKGEKALFRAHVEKTGESLNGFFYRAGKEAMERESQEEQN